MLILTGGSNLPEVISGTIRREEAVACPGDSVGTDVRFQIEPIEDGRCRVDVVHDGWPGTGGNFTKCNTLWGALVFSLRRFAETSTPAPAFT